MCNLFCKLQSLYFIFVEYFHKSSIFLKLNCQHAIGILSTFLLHLTTVSFFWQTATLALALIHHSLKESNLMNDAVRQCVLDLHNICQVTFIV